MNSKRLLLKKLFLVPLLSLSGFVNAHTPYRQWKVVRKKHLLIYSNREDLKTDELAEQVNKVLKQIYLMQSGCRGRITKCSIFTDKVC